MRFRFHVLIRGLSCLAPFFLRGQAIDNTLALRNINSERYFRIHYENDFFAAFDRDYTQGIYIEKVHPSLRLFPLMKILWRPRNSAVKYGIALEQDAYTPNDIGQPGIQYGDRPYAGVLLLKTFLIATNAARHERVSTQLSTGLIGPHAGGEGMQRTIHHWINYTQPLGWHNQIRSDLALNYQVNYEKELAAVRDIFSLSSYNSLRVGTLSDKITTGITGMVGHFYNPFNNPGGYFSRRFQWYVYDQLLANAMAYDATLQGGLFNHSSPYTIASPDLDRLTLYNKFGIVIIFKHLYLEYYHTGLTEEFKTSLYHRTGGLQIGFGF